MDLNFSNAWGEAYGINVDGNDRVKQRFSGSSNNGPTNPSTAWAENLTAGNHTIQGRFGKNFNNIENATISRRRIIALWLSAGADTTPPASITNLANTTGTTWINWTWTNPADTDFNYTMIYINGTWTNNTSDPFYNLTGLSSGTTSNISTHTVDTLGNINQTWVNQTTTTLKELLTFNSKYVVTSNVSINTSSLALVNDTQANQTFNLAASKTVLVIYNPHNLMGSNETYYGKRIAINVDGSDYADTWGNGVSGVDQPDGLITFWIGTLGAGSHTIKGRFAMNQSQAGKGVTIDERVLLILILDGDAFWYLDNSTSLTTTSTSFVNDTYASQTFTPSGNSKALILYNTGAYYNAGEAVWGKKIAINISGTDNSQAEKSSDGNTNNVFTLHYGALTSQAYTVKGRFASNAGTSTVISRRQLGILLFANTTLADYNTSDVQVNTSSAYPQNDTQATISRTTTDTRELLVVAMGTKRNGTLSTVDGEAYGIKIDNNDRAKSRTSISFSAGANSVSTAYAEQLAAGSHTVQGRFGNNYLSDSAVISSRRIVALWFSVSDTTPPASITNLANTTGTTWINWTWTNPADTDFNYTMIYINGSWQANTSNPFYNLTGLGSKTTSNISTHTVDTSGNINQTWVNQTTTTLATPLTFDSKYVISSTVVNTTTSTALVNDTNAVQTFDLSASKTVLVIYSTDNDYGDTQSNAPSGRGIAIGVDGVDRAPKFQSSGAAYSNYPVGVTTFWIGTLGAGSHTIQGRFSIGAGTGTTTIHERVLLIYILNGDEFYYTESTGVNSTDSTTLVDDTNAGLSFTPSGNSKALILYSASNDPTNTHGTEGMKIGINLGGIDYSVINTSGGVWGGSGYYGGFSIHYAALTPVSQTVKGRFASIAIWIPADATRNISRRSLGVLLFANSTLTDYNSSDTQVVSTSPGSPYPIDDAQATINRTTTDTRELLVIASAWKLHNSQSSYFGEAYGIKVDANDRVKQRFSPTDYDLPTNPSTAWAETLTAGNHTIQGRFGNNYGTDTARIDSRRIIALWLSVDGGAGQPDLVMTQANISFSYASNSSQVETGDVKEGVSVTINATVYNNGTGSASNVKVSFYDGSPGSNNNIANTTIASIAASTSQNATVYWNSLAGTHNISVKVDPDNNNSESSETNNDASKLLNVSAWQKYYGNISGNRSLRDNPGNYFTNWSWVGQQGNVFITNVSNLNLNNLQALGRNKDGTPAQNNFSRADVILSLTVGSRNATDFANNNITQLFSTNGTTPRNTTCFTIYGNTINNVSIVNSTNVTNITSVENATFITGILWDTTKDNGDGTYGDDGEDLVFIAKINQGKTGLVGTAHDYEIAVPSSLKGTGVVYFYVELK